ncbi:hypothetical protein BCR36DRAFT_581716 [Piromyces finnis]|uniref:Uncharacterized protein n=1 Tax=Piromyces finnis TaxID=1754191 RepID=A0A1Y1VGJ6_9FUNG|nr:hypothetical protein BCR36DRAFT_581716 [Piromyces finnis]|eukprot:ORX54831.1 hypothetical protein BCR36DRAFT_581716 [Piromyces finnis]
MMPEQDNTKTYLIYGGVIVVILLVLLVSCIYVEYYKRKVKRLKLELYRETRGKERQLSSNNNSVLTTHYNFLSYVQNENNTTNQGGIKKVAYIDGYEDDDNITSLSNYVSYDNKNNTRKDKLSYISEGTSEMQGKSRDKYQSLNSINTTTQSVHSLKPSYSYYSLNNTTDNYRHQSSYSLNLLQDPIAYQAQDAVQQPPSLYLNSHNNMLFYDEVPNHNINSPIDSATTISTTTTTTITTNTNINNINSMSYIPTTTNRSTIRGYLSRPQVISSIHEDLRINTSGLKYGNSSKNGYKISPKTISPNSIVQSSSTVPKHRLLNRSSNSPFIQNQDESPSFFTTKPLSTSLITATTESMAQKSSYGHYELSNTTLDTQGTDIISDDKRISLLQNQEKYSSSSLRNSIDNNNKENQDNIKKDGEITLKKKKVENRRSYTEQLKPILSNISLAELKEANALRSQSARLPSDKVKVIKVRKHLSYTEQLTPVLIDKHSSILSEHQIEKTKFRHSIQSLQSIHSAQSAHSVHNVVDEELVSPRPISLISNKRLSVMTSEIENQLNEESKLDEEKIDDEVIVIEENKDIYETYENTPSPATAAKLSWKKTDKETLEEMEEKDKNESSALTRVSLLIDKLENSAALNSSVSPSSDSLNNAKRNNRGSRHFIHSPLSDNGDKHTSLTYSIDENIKTENKRNSERSSRYYSKQRLSLISNYSEISDHNDHNSLVLKLYKKPSISTVSSNTTSVPSHSPYSKRTSISPLPSKKRTSYQRSPLDNELPSLSLKNVSNVVEDGKNIKELKEKSNSSYISSSVVIEEDEENEDDRKEIIEETASSKKTLSVSSSSISRSIYMDVRKEGSIIPSINDSEQEIDNTNTQRKGKEFSGLYNFFEVRPEKNKQRKAQSSGTSTSQNMKFEEISESDINPLIKSYYDSDSNIIEGHEFKKQSFNSSSSNLNNFDYNISFSFSQKNSKYNDGGKDKAVDREREKIFDLLKENNSSSINSNISGPMVKSAIYSYYSNPSNGGNSQYQNENINLKFLNNSFNGSVNFNNESFDTNEDDDDNISNGYGIEMGEKLDRSHNLLIDRRSLYSMNQPAKPPKSYRRQHHSLINPPNHLAFASSRDDDMHSNSSASLNFAEIQRYQNASMPMALDKYKNYYYQSSFPTTKSNTSSVTSQTVQNIYGYNNQSSNHDEDDTIKDINENHEMNTSFSSKSYSLLAHSTSEHSTHSTFSYHSSNAIPSYKKLTVSSPISAVSSNTNIISNNKVTSPLQSSSKSGISDNIANELENSKTVLKKNTSEPWSGASLKSSTSVVSCSSSNYSSDVKEGHHTVNETEKLPQRIKDSVPKRSQYSSQKEKRRSSSTHRKRKHSGSMRPPTIITNTRNKEKNSMVDDIDNEASFSLTLYSPSQSINKTTESKSQSTSLQHFIQNTDASESNINSSQFSKKSKDDNNQNNGFGNNNMNITVNHLSLDMTINKETKNYFNHSPESLDSAKTLNNSLLFNNTKNKDKEQENVSLKTTSPFSIVNSQPVIEEKGDSKVDSLKSSFSSSYYNSNPDATVPLLRDIISDSILQMQSRKLHPIPGKVHILSDHSSPNPSPNITPESTPKFIKSNIDDYSNGTESIRDTSSTESSSSQENKSIEDEELSSSQPIPSFIFNENIINNTKNESPKLVSKSQESDTNTINTNIPKLSNRMPEKRKYDVMYHNTSPLIKSHTIKKKLLSSGVSSPIYPKSSNHLTTAIQRKASPLSFYNSIMVRNNYSPLSRIEEDGSMEQSFTAPTPTYTHHHVNLENNDFSVGTDTSRTSDSTTVTEYKNIPNATDQSTSIIYNKSSISSSSDEYSDEEEIISVDINLISQDDASTYNSPFLFPVITPPNYEQLIKDQSYKL